MVEPTGYVICTTPRSGSTLLCRMLAATGLAGDPESLFHRPSLEHWAKSLGVTRSPNMSDRDYAREIFAASIPVGQGGTPVFAFRQQPHALGFFCEVLRDVVPEAQSDAARMSEVFGPLKFIRLTRTDKLAQAISLVIAEQTGLWHRNADGTEYERLAPPAPPKFDRPSIEAAVERFKGYDNDWEEWFSQQAIEPLHLNYEALAADPKSVLAHVLGYLGLPESSADTIEVPMQRLSNAVTENWLERMARG